MDTAIILIGLVALITLMLGLPDPYVDGPEKLRDSDHSGGAETPEEVGCADGPADT